MRNKGLDMKHLQLQPSDSKSTLQARRYGQQTWIGRPSCGRISQILRSGWYKATESRFPSVSAYRKEAKTCIHFSRSIVQLMKSTPGGWSTGQVPAQKVLWLIAWFSHSGACPSQLWVIILQTDQNRTDTESIRIHLEFQKARIKWYTHVYFTDWKSWWELKWKNNHGRNCYQKTQKPKPAIKWQQNKTRCPKIGLPGDRKTPADRERRVTHKIHILPPWFFTAQLYYIYHLHNIVSHMEYFLGFYLTQFAFATYI